MGKGSLLRKMLSFEFAIEDVAPPRKSCSRSKKKKHRIPAESSASKQTTANSPSSTLPSLIRPTTESAPASGFASSYAREPRSSGHQDANASRAEDRA
ncbi:hypothetical protein KEM48_013625 [Puccinia striiformis f. sp. tritici PST-130]|nr:hypothetical protein KEM48_013625 [Puccinia striiformis f. sp. tritici PST-130]